MENEPVSSLHKTKQSTDFEGFAEGVDLTQLPEGWKPGWTRTQCDENSRQTRVLPLKRVHVVPQALDLFVLNVDGFLCLVLQGHQLHLQILDGVFGKVTGRNMFTCGCKIESFSCLALRDSSTIPVERKMIQPGAVCMNSE